MLAQLAEQLGIPVVGLADYNPHGLALLQTYRRGGIQTSLEAGDVSTEVKWLGLRASHIEDMPWVGQGEALTDRDEAVVANLRAQVYISSDPRYMAEVEAMKGCGKHELQCLYGHPSGTKYLSNEFLPTALLQHDYI
jgi:DNA topoisomerase VI subunit A